MKLNLLLSKPIVGYVYLFFCFMPLSNGLYKAASKWCISDQSMESIAEAYIHHFETAIRFDYVRA